MEKIYSIILPMLIILWSRIDLSISADDSNEPDPDQKLTNFCKDEGSINESCVESFKDKFADWWKLDQITLADNALFCKQRLLIENNLCIDVLSFLMTNGWFSDQVEVLLHSLKNTADEETYSYGTSAEIAQTLITSNYIISYKQWKTYEKEKHIGAMSSFVYALPLKPFDRVKEILNNIKFLPKNPKCTAIELILLPDFLSTNEASQSNLEAESPKDSILKVCYGSGKSCYWSAEHLKIMSSKPSFHNYTPSEKESFAKNGCEWINVKEMNWTLEEYIQLFTIADDSNHQHSKDYYSLAEAILTKLHKRYSYSESLKFLQRFSPIIRDEKSTRALKDELEYAVSFNNGLIYMEKLLNITEKSYGRDLPEKFIMGMKQIRTKLVKAYAYDSPHLFDKVINIADDSTTTLQDIYYSQ